MPKATAKKLAYVAQYDRANRVAVSVQLNRTHDADILDHLDTIEEPRAAYIKRLIREDIAAHA